MYLGALHALGAQFEIKLLNLKDTICYLIITLSCNFFFKTSISSFENCVDPYTGVLQVTRIKIGRSVVQ